MSILSFDIETTKGGDITVAACAWRNSENYNIEFFEAYPFMQQEEAMRLVEFILTMNDKGYIPFAHNGVGFDFRLLANASGMVKECAYLAMNSYDTMLEVMFRKGYPVSLQAIADGFGVKGKIKQVTLSSGEILEEMHGSKAPDMWEAREFAAVKAYLEGDVELPLRLYDMISGEGVIKWLSRKEKLMSVNIDGFSLVKDLFKIPVPDTSWAAVGRLPTRESIISWMP